MLSYAACVHLTDTLPVCVSKQIALVLLTPHDSPISVLFPLVPLRLSKTCFKLVRYVATGADPVYQSV